MKQNLLLYKNIYSTIQTQHRICAQKVVTKIANQEA